MENKTERDPAEEIQPAAQTQTATETQPAAEAQNGASGEAYPPQAGPLLTLLKSGLLKWLGIWSVIATTIYLPLALINLSSFPLLTGVLSVIQTFFSLFFAVSWLNLYQNPKRGAYLHRIAAYCLFAGFIASSLYSLYSLYTALNLSQASIAGLGTDKAGITSVVPVILIFLMVIVAVILAFEARFFWLRGSVTRNMENCLADLPWARERAGKAKGYALAFFIIGCAAFGLIALLLPAFLTLNSSNQLGVELSQMLPFKTPIGNILYGISLLISQVTMFMEYRFYKGAQALGL